MTLPEAVRALTDRQDLSEDESAAVMTTIMTGGATHAQLAAFLVALRMKGETAGEIAGCARAMRAVSTKIRSTRTPLVDTCGTGGDGSGSFNISTAAAIVTAAAGVAVAKHGNRAVSSKAGSADVLEALGIRLDPDPDVVGRILDEVGISFLFAPRLHPAMKHAAPVRKELGLRTVFNLLGPLTNPADAGIQVLGVYDEGLTETMAGVLLRLGSLRAYVVHGRDGLDEFSVSGPTRVSELREGSIRTYEFTPAEAGLGVHQREAVAGGSADDNARIIRDVVAGSKSARRDIVVLNAGAALAAAGSAPDIRAGVSRASEAIDSGEARKLMGRWIEASQDIAS